MTWKQSRVIAKYLRTVGVGFERVSPTSDGVCVFGFEGELTFDDLAKLSEVLKTRSIDIKCDLGCESDHSHNTYLIVRNIPPEHLEQILEAKVG